MKLCDVFIRFRLTSDVELGGGDGVVDWCANVFHDALRDAPHLRLVDTEHARFIGGFDIDVTPAEPGDVIP